MNRYQLESITDIFTCILILNVYFELCTVFTVYYFVPMYWSKNLCHISMFLSFVTRLPENDRMSDRNV